MRTGSTGLRDGLSVPRSVELPMATPGLRLGAVAWMDPRASDIAGRLAWRSPTRTSVVERIAEDEAAARTSGRGSIEPDLRSASTPDRRSRMRLAMARSALIDVPQATRWSGISGRRARRTLTGRLHLTRDRLVLTGADPDRRSTSRPIEELSLVGERLLVGLGDGTGLTPRHRRAPRVPRPDAAVRHRPGALSRPQRATARPGTPTLAAFREPPGRLRPVPRIELAQDVA